MWWIIALGAGIGIIWGISRAASAHGVPDTDENVEYLARMLCMHSSLTEPEWIGLSWLVLNRIQAGRCRTVRECVTSTSWSTNEERRRRLAAPSGYQDASGKPAPPDSPRWEEALALAEEILQGQHPNPIGQRRHFIHPQALHDCTAEGSRDGNYECRGGKLYPLWALPEYAEQTPIMIGITLFS